MKMKWTSKALGADLNESKLNAREDNPDNLFEITPTFRLTVEDEGQNDLAKGKKIFAVTAGGQDDPIGIAVGSQFLILNKKRDEVDKTIEFKAPIDVIVWRRSVLIVGLSNSEINLLCPHTFQMKESKKVSTDVPEFSQDQFFVDAFIHSNPDPTKIDLLAIGVNGVIYSFQDVLLVDGSSMENTLDENMTLDIDVATIKGTVLRFLDTNAHILSATSPARNFIITGEENGKLSIFELWKDGFANYGLDQRVFLDIDITKYLDLPDHAKIKKIVRCEGLLFVLFTNGHLEILLDDQLYPTGNLELPGSNSVVHDFAMVIYSADVIKLWAIFSNSENEHFIGIFAGPNFRSEFIAGIPTPSESVGNKATIYLFPRQTNPFDEPTTVIAVEPSGLTTLFHMSESSTDVSLQNLLTKSRFDKAELLARKYGKDLNLVWKAKVRAKFNEVVSGKNEKSIERSFRELVSTLQLVQDAEFVCGFCTTREKGIPRLDWVKELLALGLKRVSECSRSAAGQTLLLTWKKLYTFDQVLATGDTNQWNQFNDENNTMFSQCSWFLELNEFKKCEIVWLRHSDEFIPHIDLQHFAVFFKVLFEKRLGSPDSISLFKTIFPFAIGKCESETELGGNQVNINAFMGLIRSQIRSLEREIGWPNEAIVFTNSLIGIIQEEHGNFEEEKTNTGEIRIDKKLSICVDILATMKKLLQALTELLNLKTAHSIRIEFEKYFTESVSEVVNSMLKLLFAKDEVERYVNKFLRPYARRNNLDMDTLFGNHIKSAVDDVQYFINSGAIPFEERLITLVGFIETPKIKLTCVLRMTEEWPVPWHPLMKGVVTHCLEVNVTGDEECRELQKVIRLMETQVPYRCLLHKYRFTPSKLSKGFGVYMALKRIIEWKKVNYWEDCLELIKHTGKYTLDSVSTINFSYELSLTTPIEDVIPADQKGNVELQLRYLRRVLHNFRKAINQSEESEAVWKRYTECAKSIANQVNDDRTLEFLNLKQLIPNFWDDDIVNSTNYPFSALELLLPKANSLSSAQIIAECDKLSVLSFSNSNDFLVVTAAFLAGPGNLGSAFQKIWDLISRIVETPIGFSGNSIEVNTVPMAGLGVAHHVVLFASSTSSEYLNTLVEFCGKLQRSYEDVAESVAKLLTIIWIFQGLREAEIPLEREFANIYKGVWREGIKNAQELLSQLQGIGEVILRFGSSELLNQIFNGVHHELMYQSTNLFGEIRDTTIEAASSVLNLKLKLLNERSAFEQPENNLRIRNLVTALEEAGLSMNSYALRERNKEKLIGKLLDINLFHLAAQTALVFDFRDQRSWSSILQEYMAKASIIELKTILESLKKITDLWVLPEFSQAWLKVSETYPNFKHVCPIPLNY